MGPKDDERMAYSVDPAHGLHCLPRPVSLKTEDYYNTMWATSKKIWAAAWQNQHNDLCAQWRLISLDLHPVESQSWLCVQWVAKDPNFVHADSEDSDQSGRTDHFVVFFFVMLQLTCRWNLRPGMTQTGLLSTEASSRLEILKYSNYLDSEKQSNWSNCFFWTHCCILKPHCLNFRIITAIFLMFKVPKNKLP